MELVTRRAAILVGALALGLVGLVCAVGIAADDGVSGGPDAVTSSPVIGRFAVDSEAGGAVWSFQPSGQLVVVGPGDLIAEGVWAPGSRPGEVDAELEVPVSGQALRVLGAVSPDGSQLALYVTASEATSPLDGIPWPLVSRLVGDRVGLVADSSASPAAPPEECQRPAWGDGDSVDWDRCDVATTPPTSPALTEPASPSPSG